MSIEIFRKAIDRHIDGVIKADDDSSLWLELDEYVLTGEAQSRLEDFLEAYNSHSANGAWISGFFGSGKSHLLKMLAIVLENREINGQRASDIFLRDKCMDIPTLKGLLSKAVSIPSKSILFNIDQKADIISKTQDDAVLSVFLKVFNESCGYYSKQPHIAQMERELDEEGLLERFRQSFQEITGKDWDFGRSRSARYSAAIDQAYSQVTGSDKTGIIDYYSKNYKLSIDDFANLVKEYIDRQEKTHPGFRLNFFVDEVGQYVANSIKLMTNLQTIAESLNTVCKMRSWLIVTSQSNVSDIVGEMTRQSGNDFSKIEGRFSKKIALTGANADEVIRRRLLEKKPDCMGELSKLYRKYENDFKTMFDFADGSKRYRSYADEEAFISCYPFVPYQFDLFQATMLNLSSKEAFTGKYTAIAERSMLAVCQDAAKKLCKDAEKKIGSVVPFDYWYEGIRLALKPAQINQIIVAEHQLSDPLEIRLLKALFLVKYVREFKATVRNLSILMIDDLGVNVAELRKRTEEALAHLERESYLQRVGDNYEYLTDEEKDIDKEIKATYVSPEEIDKFYKEILFDTIIRAPRLTCTNGASYAYIPRIDGRDIGRANSDLAIHFITPQNPNCDNLQALKMQCLGRDEAMFVLPIDPMLIVDVTTFKKTERYLRQNPAAAQPDGQRKRLLEARGDSNRSIRARIEERLKSLISAAPVFICGEDAKTATTEPRSKIGSCFDELATRVYSSYAMISGMGGITEADVHRFLKKDAKLPGIPDTLSEAEQDILAFVRTNEQRGLRSTMKTLTERFEGKPYGWPLGVIDCLVARLWANGHLEASLNGEMLQEASLKNSLLNTHQHSDLVLSLAQQFTPAQIRRVKEFMQDFFAVPVPSQDAKAVGEELLEQFKQLASTLKNLLVQHDSYPFVNGLGESVGTVSKIVGHPWTWFFGEDFAKQMEELLDAKDNLIDPICGAFHNGQAEIYAAAKQFYMEQKVNFPFIKGDPVAYDASGTEEEKLRQLLESPAVYKNAGFKQIKALRENLEKQVAEATAKLHATVEAKVNEQLKQLRASDAYRNATTEARQAVDDTVTAFLANAKQERLLPTLSWNLQNFLYSQIPRFYEILTPPPPSSNAGKGDGDKPKAAKVVPLHSVKPEMGKSMLETPEDIDTYVDALRKRLLDEIEAGNKVFLG